MLILAINLKKLLVRFASYLESKRAFDFAVTRGCGLRKIGQSNLIEMTDEDIGSYSVTLRRGTSDFAVYCQCLVEKQYEPVVRLLRRCILSEEVRTIVDAGANVGLSVLYLGRSFPEAKIVALEPDEENFALCCKNVADNRLSNVTVIQKALWKEDVRLALSTEFRDGREWAYQVSPLRTEESPIRGTVDGVCLSTLFQHYDIEVVDLLKVDIEGAEKFVFEQRSDVAVWLPRVRVIAVEIHDSEGRELIVSLLQRHTFFVFQNGELTMGVNQRLTDQSQLLEYFRARSEVQVL